MKKHLICSFLFVFLLVSCLLWGATRANAAELIEGVCGVDAWWEFDGINGVLRIAGSGEMYDFERGKDIPWKSVRTEIRKVVINSGITRIGDYAFYNYSWIETVEIPNTVTCIGEYAFSGCGNLVNVNLPESLTELGKGAFSGCTDLSRITIPSSLRQISAESFGATGLTSITIPATVESIEKKAFASCYSLLAVHFAGDAPAISGEAFNAVKTAASYPASNSTWTSDKKLWYGGDIAWYADNGSGPQVSGTHGDLKWELKGNTLYISSNVSTAVERIPNNPEWLGYKGLIEKVVMTGDVGWVGIGAFKGCIYLKEVQWSGGVAGISGDAFYNCKSLESLVIPNSVTFIGTSAFYGCEKLKTIALSKSIETIEIKAFWGCTSLQSITIPASAKRIYTEAFYGCTSLKTIRFEGKKPELQDAIKAEPGKIVNGVLIYTPADPGALGGINNVTVYYPENAQGWTAKNLEVLNQQYGQNNLVFTSYQVESEGPEKVPTETTGPVVQEPDPTEETPTENTVAPEDDDTTGGLTQEEGKVTDATEPTQQDGPNTSETGGKWWIAVVIVVIAAAAGTVLLMKRKKQDAV